VEGLEGELKGGWMEAEDWLMGFIGIDGLDFVGRIFVIERFLYPRPSCLGAHLSVAEPMDSFLF